MGAGSHDHTIYFTTNYATSDPAWQKLLKQKDFSIADMRLVSDIGWNGDRDYKTEITGYWVDKKEEKENKNMRYVWEVMIIDKEDEELVEIITVVAKDRDTAIIKAEINQVMLINHLDIANTEVIVKEIASYSID